MESEENLFTVEGMTTLLVEGWAKYHDPFVLKHAPTLVRALTKRKGIMKTSGILTDLTNDLNQIAEHLKGWTAPFGQADLLRIHGWQGVDQGTSQWHNDSREGQNLTVMLYLDNMYEEIGGCVEIKHDCWHRTIYPKAGDIVFINQREGFLHRATSCLSLRRVVSADYKIKAWSR